MATKRVSWELIIGCTYLYFDVRKQAVARAREEKAQGYSVEMNRWEMVGDHDPTHAPVDLDTLIAKAERREAGESKRIQAILDEPLPPLPQSVLRDVARALSDF